MTIPPRFVAVQLVHPCDPTLLVWVNIWSCYNIDGIEKGTQFARWERPPNKARGMHPVDLTESEEEGSSNPPEKRARSREEASRAATRSLKPVEIDELISRLTPDQLRKFHGRTEGSRRLKRLKRIKPEGLHGMRSSLLEARKFFARSWVAEVPALCML